jgi:hypothetical protein
MASGEEDKLRAALDALAEAEQGGAADGRRTAENAELEPEPEPEPEPPLAPQPEPQLQPTGDQLEDFFGGEQPSPTGSQLEVSAAAGGAVASDVDPWILLSPTLQPSPLSQSPESGEGAEGVAIDSEAADILADFFGSCTSIAMILIDPP